MNNLKRGQLKWPSSQYMYTCVCITKKERMLFFLAKVHYFAIFSKLILFTHSAQKFLSKLLYSYTYIYILAISPGYTFRDLYKRACCQCCSKQWKPGPEHCHCIWSANQLKRCLLSGHLFWSSTWGIWRNYVSGLERGYCKFILKYKLRARKMEIPVEFYTLFSFFFF